MNYIPLTPEQKAEISSENGCEFAGHQVAFLLKGVEIARTDLIEKSFATQRFRLAEMIGIEEFDDYWLINPDGGVRAKASDVKGLSVTDIDTDFGTAQGIKYQQFLERRDIRRCAHCGELAAPELVNLRLSEGMKRTRRFLEELEKEKKENTKE